MGKIPVQSEALKQLQKDIEELGIDVVINRLKFISGKSKYKVTKIRDNNS